MNCTALACVAVVCPPNLCSHFLDPLMSVAQSSVEFSCSEPRKLRLRKVYNFTTNQLMVGWWLILIFEAQSSGHCSQAPTNSTFELPTLGDGTDACRPWVQRTQQLQRSDSNLSTNIAADMRTNSTMFRKMHGFNKPLKDWNPEAFRQSNNR